MAETVITDYVLARDATITVNGAKQRATSASYRRAGGEVDMSNLRSSREWEGVTDIIRSDFQMSIAVSAAEGIPLPEVGSICPLDYTTAGGKSHTGMLLILSSSETAGPRGSYNYSITGVTTGPTVNS